ncbi:hypothetical protein JTB14_003229 [Gonioctena quinquepunctata]|nr:hypothetical protein JTB14_003229 [Gonioctena quinquepunctata]
MTASRRTLLVISVENEDWERSSLAHCCRRERQQASSTFRIKGCHPQACLCISVENEDCGLATQIGVRNRRMALGLQCWQLAIFENRLAIQNTVGTRGTVDPTREEALQVDLRVKSDCNPLQMRNKRRRGVAGAKPTDGKMGRNPGLMMAFGWAKTVFWAVRYGKRAGRRFFGARRACRLCE